MLHKDSTLGSRHAVHNWEVADYAALLALVVVAADKGKMAQVGADSYYILANHVGPVWTQVDPGLSFFSFNRTSALILATGQARWYPPANTEIKTIEGWLSEAPSGAAVIAKVMKNGVTEIATVTIADGATTAAKQTVALVLLSTDYLTINVTQIGSTAPGKDLVIRLGMN